MTHLFTRCLSTALFSLLSMSTLGAEKPQAVDSFISKDAIISRGLMNSIQQNDHYYLEIPDRLMGRDLLVTITITRGATRKERQDDMRFGYGGDSMYDKLIRLQKRGNNIYIEFPERNATDTTTHNGNYLKNIATPIYMALPVLAQSDSTSLVDITRMIMGDDQLFSLKAATTPLKLGGAISQFTSIESIQAFPNNVNFLSRRSYTLTEPAKGEQPNSQWEVCASWMLLPEKPMTPRVFDSRVGYFNTGVFGLPSDNDKLEIGMLANRWRLEPKIEDIERYRRGELVEPQKPIIFYISQTVPDYLRPYFIKAVNNWQKAFEKAGFRNAIHAEMAPTDSTYDEGDIRYPLVSYKASPIPNAYGPQVVDPRSGEIITSHIAIYHSVLDLIQRWYFVMCSQIDQRARSYPLDKSIVGRLAETVLTHEVGHTLGLRHNFIASTLHPVDSLRSAQFVHDHGLGGSIMDYQRFNYIPQPNDKVNPDDLLPRISAYDNFAIEWGYRYFPDESYQETARRLRSWVSEKRASDRSCLYVEESQLGDPRVQSEDSGDDDIKANTYGMDNLKYIMAHLEQWTQTPDSDYYPLRRRYLSVMNQYWNYIGHITRYVDGHYNDFPDRGERLNSATPVPREQQLRALQFMKDHLFSEPTWLWRPELMSKTGINWDDYVLSSASRNIGILFLKYSSMTSSNVTKESLSPDELFNFIYDNLYGRYADGEKLSLYVRHIQRNFLTDLTLSAENPSTFGTGVGLQLKQLLERIKLHAQKAAQATTDNLTRQHHEAVARFIGMWQTGDNRELLK